MDAITTQDEKAVVNLDRCIGCGNCVAVCPEDAIQLVKNDKVDEVPKNEDEMFEKILEAKMKMKGM